MVAIKSNIKEVPRAQIDALEGILGILLNPSGRVDCSADYDSRRNGPFATLALAYKEGKIEAKGVDPKGSFTLNITLDVPEDVYQAMLKALQSKAPLIAASIDQTVYTK